MNNTKNIVIAKNSIALFVRMLFMMGITFFTSRVILKNLGVVDYGISNVVGGVVAMLSAINGSLAGGSSRFIMVSLVNDTIDKTKSLFNTIVTIYAIYAIIFFILIEIIGLWLLSTHLIIPENRQAAALIAFQCSVATAIITILSTPFNADIIAHEKMDAFAYISIVEAAGRLLIAFCIQYTTYDRLIFYSVLLVIVQLTIRFLYNSYCKKHFDEGNWHIEYNKNIANDIFHYVGWLAFGSIAWITSTQGVNIVLNMFFGPAVNAARGLSVQIQNALTQFSNSFITAIRPQLIQTYTKGDLDRMYFLLMSGSKLGIYLMLLIAIPLFLKTPYVLGIWLEEVPENTVFFVRIIICLSLINVLKEPTLAAIHATGDIKKFQIVESLIMLTTCPIAYLGLKFYGISANMVFCIYLFVEILTQNARIIVVYPRIGIPIIAFYKNILAWIVPTLSLCFCSSYFLMRLLPDDGVINFGIFIVLNILPTICIVFLVGLSKREKKLVINIIKKYLYKKLC